MYDVHLALVGKRVVHFLLVIIELFSLEVTAKALRAKIDKKICDFAPTRSVLPKISGRRGRRPKIILAWIVRPMNALYSLVADSFHTKKLCSKLSSTEVRFLIENGRFAFLSPLWGLRGNVR